MPVVNNPMISYAWSASHLAKKFKRTDVPWDEFAKRNMGIADGLKGSAGCSCNAVFEGDLRAAHRALQVDVISLDIDIHVPLYHLLAVTRRLGWEAVVHTTASHGKTETEVTAKMFEAYRKRKHAEGWQGSDEKLAELRLREDGHHEELIPPGGVTLRQYSKVVNRRDRAGKLHPSDVPCVGIQHLPINKFRIHLLLSRPWRIDEYPSVKEALEAYEELYRRIIDAFGLPADESCRTADRIMFRTAIPQADVERRSMHRAFRVRGAAINPWALPPSKPRLRRAGVFQHGRIEGDYEVENHRRWFRPSCVEFMERDENGVLTGRVFDVLDWWYRRGQGFLLATALLARGVAIPSERADGSSGQVHIDCPFEDEHTPTGGGFFVRDAELALDGSNTLIRWGLNCSHNTCQGRHPLDYILKFLDTGMLLIEDLENDEYLLEPRIRAADEFEDIEAPDDCVVIGRDPLWKLLLQPGCPERLRSLLEGRKDAAVKPLIDAEWELTRVVGSAEWLALLAETENAEPGAWASAFLRRLLTERPSAIGNGEVEDLLDTLRSVEQGRYGQYVTELRSTLGAVRVNGRALISGQAFDAALAAGKRRRNRRQSASSALPAADDSSDQTGGPDGGLDEIAGRLHGLLTDPETGEVETNVYTNALVAVRALAGQSLRYDEFSEQIVLSGRPRGFPGGREDWVQRSLDDDTDGPELLTIAERLGVRTKLSDVRTACRHVALANRFNSFVDYINSLQWDGVPRLDGWLTRYCGADDTALNRFFASSFLIAGVRRGMRSLYPDVEVKVDTALVLEGPQGLKKSTVFKALVKRDWFTDQLHDFQARDEKQKLAGKLIVELAELAVVRKSEVNQIKAFLAMDSDLYRSPYAYAPKEHPRTAVFAGTINPNGAEYLADTTGSRRFNIVVVRPVTKSGHLDVPGLVAVRDMLWAEAKVRADAGEPHWLEEGDLKQAHAEVTEDRTTGDAWMDPIADWLDTPETDADGNPIKGPDGGPVLIQETSTGQLLQQVIGMPVERHDARSQMRIGVIMAQLGWRRVRKWVGSDGRRYVYARPLSV